jgi:predicted lipid-binding transport protein (Tim44 family)
MIPLGWRVAGGLGAAIAIGSGGYALGDRAGANRVLAREAKLAGRVVAATERIRSATDRIAAAVAAGRNEKVTLERTIYRDAIKIVDRPVYRVICVDADGVRLLDRAQAVANSEPAGVPADEAGDAAADAPQGRRDAGRPAMSDRRP